MNNKLLRLGSAGSSRRRTDLNVSSLWAADGNRNSCRRHDKQLPAQSLLDFHFSLLLLRLQELFQRVYCVDQRYRKHINRSNKSRTDSWRISPVTHEACRLLDLFTIWMLSWFHFGSITPEFTKLQAAGSAGWNDKHYRFHQGGWTPALILEQFPSIRTDDWSTHQSVC